MKDFKHPNVLSLTGICFDTPDGIPYILLPYMANGSLKDYLKRKRVHVTDVDTFPEVIDSILYRTISLGPQPLHVKRRRKKN